MKPAIQIAADLFGHCCYSRDGILLLAREITRIREESVAIGYRRGVEETENRLGRPKVVGHGTGFAAEIVNGGIKMSTPEKNFDTYFDTYILLQTGIVAQKGAQWVLEKDFAGVTSGTTFNSPDELIQRLKMQTRTQYDANGGVLKVA